MSKMNKKILIPTIALLAALLIAPAMAARADTVVIGGGWIIDEDGNRANFAFNFDSDRNGRVQYSVSGEWHMSSIAIDGFTHRDELEPTWVQINGRCRVTDLSTGLTDEVDFQLEVQDFSVPGGQDIPHEGELGDWIIMYVGEDYISYVGDGDPNEGQHIDNGNILHRGRLGPYP